MSTLKATIEAQAAVIAALQAKVDALTAAPVASSHYVKADLACTASPRCARTDLRTAARAAIHGVDKGGHTARTAKEIAARK